MDGSGSLNYAGDSAAHIFHSACLQKTDIGSVELYHTNCQRLNMAMLAEGKVSTKKGLVTHYELSNPDTQRRYQEGRVIQ